LFCFPKLNSGWGVYGKNDKWKLGAYYILEYDRDIYKNLDYLSGSVICHSFGKERDSDWVVIWCWYSLLLVIILMILV
jgi:hypothetical protein